MKKKSILLETCAALLIALYLYTALSKLLDFKAFVESINYQPFDNAYTPFIVYTLPAVEIICAGMLIFNVTRRYGFYLSLLLMTIFTGYVSLIMLNFYGKFPCSCGGAISTMTWPQHLWFNIFFLILSGIGAFADRLNFSNNLRMPHLQKARQQ